MERVETHCHAEMSCSSSVATKTARRQGSQLEDQIKASPGSFIRAAIECKAWS